MSACGRIPLIACKTEPASSAGGRKVVKVHLNFAVLEKGIKS